MIDSGGYEILSYEKAKDKIKEIDKKTPFTKGIIHMEVFTVLDAEYKHLQDTLAKSRKENDLASIESLEDFIPWVEMMLTMLKLHTTPLEQESNIKH